MLTDMSDCCKTYSICLTPMSFKDTVREIINNLHFPAFYDRLFFT